jgi:hypothetical protein
MYFQNVNIGQESGGQVLRAEGLAFLSIGAAAKKNKGLGLGSLCAVSERAECCAVV